MVGPAPLTPIQHWFFAQDVADPHHYNQSTMIEVPASLRPDTIERALAAVTTHHDALRLSFERVAGAWQQAHAAPPLAIALGVTSLADAAPAARQAAMLATATGMQESFTLSAPPLLRAHLFQFGPDAPQRLLVVAHHLVIDGVSWRILFEDLYTACRQLEAGHVVQLPARTTAWRDWSTRLSELGATALDGLGPTTGSTGTPASRRASTICRSAPAPKPARRSSSSTRSRHSRCCRTCRVHSTRRSMKSC